MRRILAALLATIVLIGGTAGIASAEPPVIGGGSSTGPKPPPDPGNNPGNPGNGGGGGEPSPYVTQYIPLPPKATVWQVPEFGNHTVVCGKQPGSWYAIGVRITLLRDGDTYRWVSGDCVYPPKPFIVNRVCAGHVDLTVVGPMRNPVVKSRTIYDARESAKFETTKALRDCDESISAYVTQPLRDLGRYLLTADTVVYAVKVRVHPGTSQPDEILSTTRRVMPQRGWRAQVWCDGWSSDWSGNHSYTMTECLSKGIGNAKCVVGGGSYGGIKGGRVEAFHDGTARPLTFGALKVTGARNVSVKSTSLLVDADSTPWSINPADGPYSETQPFVLKALGTNPDRTQWSLAFQSAGHPDKPWTARKKATFAADFTLRTVTIRSIDLATGKPTITSTTVTRRLDASCISPPIEIDVYRARNSN